MNAQTWSVEVDGETIKVENTASTLKLFINDKVQDAYFGMIGNPHLYGNLSNGKEVKVAYGGDLKCHCYIFVDNELVFEE